MAAASTLAARIVRAMQARKCQIDTAPGEKTIGYIRGMEPNGVANDNAPNAFNDLRWVLEFVNGEPKIIRAWQATVEPGIKYVRNRINPKGAAFIVDGQQRAWQVDLHRGHHEALCQRAGPVTVTRDDNEDSNPAGDELDSGWHGINQHGGYGQPPSDIGGASAGCLVTPSMADQAEFMRIVKSDPRYIADRKFVFSTVVLPAKEVLADGPYVPPSLPAVASTEQRRRMAKAILDFEAQRDSQGRIKVYVPPANDGGGAFEVAGINYRYHPQEASKLKELIETGRYAEAEQAAMTYILAYTDVVAGWVPGDLGIEFYLRDSAFNRGPTGAARILQRAVDVDDDGLVGPKTRTAAANLLGAPA